jgi:NAD(P)-dependent dehydrogenase (short-subunit alcohol dehydrogenase family)
VEGYTLNGKTALVTGVEHAVPRAAALALAEAGARVAVLTGSVGPRVRGEVQEVVAAVQQYQRQSRAYAVDVTDMSAVHSAVDELVREWGRLDILINGLDLPYAKPFLENTTSDWQQLFAHIVYGTLHCVHAVGAHMLRQQHGRVMTYLSILAERGMAHCTVYSAVQAALLQMTRGLAVEWGRQGITVNALGHGWLQDSPWLPPGEDECDRLVRYIPNHRLGQPDDLAALTVYLASDMGGNVTGQVMYSEGGVLSHP